MSEKIVTIFRDMTLPDVNAVLRVEQQVHSHPWTLGNFTDSLASGYICKVYEAANEIIGYAVLMPALDELQLLDMGIARAWQRQGLGRKFLGELMLLAQAQKFARMFLEVRVSNYPARALYQQAEFGETGIRRGYYPGPDGREDALMMEYLLK